MHSPYEAGGGAGTPPSWLLSPELRRRQVASAPVRPATYWADLLVSAGIGWGLFALGAALPVLSWGYAAAVLGSALAFLRAAYFIHELTHRTEQELPGFSFAWHLLVGVPVGIPSLMMWPHREHHRPATYGTREDPEYAPVPDWGRWRLLGAIGIYVIVPWLLAVRWGFTTPVSRLHPKLRAHAIGKVSTADIWHEYTRPDIPEVDRPRFERQEWVCFAFVWAALGLTVVGVLPWWIHLHRALVMTLALLLNHARLLVIHDYATDGAAVSGRGQTLDSRTLGPGSWWTELLAPIGSRFHALHHELPTVPYHALPRLHRELMAELPADHPYRGTVHAGFWAAWAERWRAVGWSSP